MLSYTGNTNNDQTVLYISGIVSFSWLVVSQFLIRR